MTDISSGAGELIHPEDEGVVVVMVVGETSKIDHVLNLLYHFVHLAVNKSGRGG